MSVSYDQSDSLEQLWNIHTTAMQKHEVIKEVPDQSLLDLKIEIASQLFSDCIFCEHRCHVNRMEKSGKCGITHSSIASEFLHHGEESFLIPSHTIFFSGCNFECVFCQNYDISQYQKGLHLDPFQLGKRINTTYEHGSCNVNWVGGDPTPHILFILETINQLDIPLPQIWNSNMYCSEETMRLLDGIIDVYLTDFKFGNDECARQLAHISNYFHVVKRNHLVAQKQTDVLIRHLVLPNHTTCCSKPILSWIATNMPNTLVNIMDQYRPSYKASSIPSLNINCPDSSVEHIKSFARSLDVTLING